jgi:hypothetical protein
MAHFSLQAKEMVHHHTYCTSYYHDDEQIVIVTPSPKGSVSTMVEKCTSWSRILAQEKVI